MKIVNLATIIALLIYAPLIASALGDVCSVPNFSAPRLLNVGAESSFVAVGDFNGDSRLDLAVPSGSWDRRAVFTNSGISIFLGKRDGAFENAVNFSVAMDPGCFLAVADFNSDGKPDLAVA